MANYLRDRTLDGRWLHEYIKTGQRRINDPDEIPEETLKSLTVGILDPKAADDSLIALLSEGFRMNVTYSLCDLPHLLDVGFRPVERLLSESQIVIYDERTLPPEHLRAVQARRYHSLVNTAALGSTRRSLRGLTLGIVGLGRIGSRVAQIARQGLGMDVQYCTRTPKPRLDASLDLHATDLDNVLTTSDIVTFHLPHHGANDLISADVIRRIPDGTTVINASVGNVIEDESLFLKRFRAGDLRGYIDVYKSLPPRLELRELRDTLTATYRLGWRTKSTVGLKTHKLLTKLAAVPPAER